jgi:RHS repeat-associated protein
MDGIGSVVAGYVYGLERISQSRSGSLRFYLADGQASTRQLADEGGNVTDQYWFEAFGGLRAKTGISENQFLYTGEYLDGNSGFYNLRARLYNPDNARFLSSDPFAGDPQAPASLHQYLYVRNCPISLHDPSGRVWQFIRGLLAHAYITLDFYKSRPGALLSYDTHVGDVPYGFLDLADYSANEFYEIKSNTPDQKAEGYRKVAFYQELLGPSSPLVPGNTYAGGSGVWPLGGTISWHLDGAGLVVYDIVGDNRGDYQWHLVNNPLFARRDLPKYVLTPAVAVGTAYVVAKYGMAIVPKLAMMNTRILQSNVAMMASLRVAF